MKTELLAPAKNIEIAKVAIDSGADAVYIGACGYGARSKAGNSIEDLKELVKYAHKFYAKVYVTVNTIIKNDEIPEVKLLIKKLYDIKVDALIVQDMAILKWSKDGEIPPIQLHISTQCDNRDLEKISFFRKLGISRVVLARELSLKQIENIKKENPNLEIECFCHGALCVSYSGQCYLSQYIGGRSANRGECAQPCRKKYSVVDSKGNKLIENKHVLCLKDFNASDYIEKMIKIGVNSFKIEGRLKDANYVKNVVGYYRKLLDKYSEKTSSGEIDLGFEPDVNKTFNRGYTHYFLNGREKCFNFDSPKFVGEYIGKIDKVCDKYVVLNLKDGIELSKQDGLCFGSDGVLGAYVNNIIGNKVYLSSTLPLKNEITVFRNLDSLYIKKLEQTNPKRNIFVNIEFEQGMLKAVDSDGNFANVLIEETEQAKNIEKNIDNFKISMSKSGADGMFKTKNISINSELPFMPISKMNEYRRSLFELLLKNRIENYKVQLQNEIKYSKYYKPELDYRENVFNSDAEAFYNCCSSKVCEYALEKNVPQDNVELMRTKHCIKYALNICKTPDKLFLVDEKNVYYPLVFDCKKCEMAVMKPAK